MSGYGFRPEYLYNPSELSYGRTEPPPIAPLRSSTTSSSSSGSHQGDASRGPLAQLESFAGCWQHCNINGPFPENMVRAGVDCDGDIIYVGRAFHEGEMIPAKVLPTKNVAYICFGGEEIIKEDFEVLRYGAFVWEFSTNGVVPETAVKIGATVDGEPLYMGRAMYGGSQTPGKVHSSHGCLYIPFGGAEVSVTEYEVLCLR